VYVARDHDGIGRGRSGRDERRTRVLRVFDAGVIEPDCKVGGALTRRDHRAARELFEGNIPQPRRIATVGPARVHRDDDRARAVGEKLVDDVERLAPTPRGSWPGA